MWQFKGERILLAREANNVTLAELARKIGVSHAQLSQWERGKILPGQDSLLKICNELKTPPKFFYVQSGNNGNDASNSEDQK